MEASTLPSTLRMANMTVAVNILHKCATSASHNCHEQTENETCSQRCFEQDLVVRLSEPQRPHALATCVSISPKTPSCVFMFSVQGKSLDCGVAMPALWGSFSGQADNCGHWCLLARVWWAPCIVLVSFCSSLRGWGGLGPSGTFRKRSCILVQRPASYWWFPWRGDAWPPLRCHFSHVWVSGTTPTTYIEKWLSPATHLTKTIAAAFYQNNVLRKSSTKCPPTCRSKQNTQKMVWYMRQSTKY